MTAQVMTNSEELRSDLLRLALRLTVSPLSTSTRDLAARTVGAVTGAMWPHDVDEGLLSAMGEELFDITHRANLGAGPMLETARRIRTLTEALCPQTSEPSATVNVTDRPDRGSACGESPVMTPGEAARYLGLDRLGVSDPAARVRYLVKKRRLRSIKVLGRVAFQRSDLDEYLVRHAGKGGR